MASHYLENNIIFTHLAFVENHSSTENDTIVTYLALVAIILFENYTTIATISDYACFFAGPHWITSAWLSSLASQNDPILTHLAFVDFENYTIAMYHPREQAP